MQIILNIARSARNGVARFFLMVDRSRELAQIAENGGDVETLRRRLELGA